MEQTRLDAIRARCEAATKGPWELTKDGRYEDHDECRINLPNDTIELCSYENGEFIAHARTDVPDLLAEVARLIAELAAMRTENLILIGEMGEQARRLAAMTAERDEARDKLDWLTEAYDRKMRVHDALNRDYVALRKRAEAVEKDFREMLYESTLLIDDALCLWCEHYDEPHDLCWAQDCKAECKWRGPQEGKP